MRAMLIVGAMTLLGACRPVTESVPRSRFVRVRDCGGPATSLAPELKAALGSSVVRTRDDEWADLAAAVPGGFAGVLYDEGQPIVMLTEPEQATEAKAALEGKIPGFPIGAAVPRQTRWDFQQLVDWYRYLVPRVMNGGVISADKDEKENRVRYGVIADSTRRRLVNALEGVDIPCDLVLIGIERQPIILR